jgi:O-acetyl-ADP-ribose deacetylase (regulator of RNase III)
VPVNSPSDAVEIISCGQRKLTLVSGLIDSLPRFGALVSSDDNYLSHGGGISLRLWKAGNIDRVMEGIELGDVFVSSAGDLNADHLLHAVTIDFDSGQRIGVGNPTALMRNVLGTAETIGCDSIALPLLGTGSAGLDTNVFIQSFAAAIRTWAEGPSSLRHVTLVVLPSQTQHINQLLAAELRSTAWAERIASAVSEGFTILPRSGCLVRHSQSKIAIYCSLFSRS